MTYGLWSACLSAFKAHQAPSATRSQCLSSSFPLPSRRRQQEHGEPLHGQGPPLLPCDLTRGDSSARALWARSGRADMPALGGSSGGRRTASCGVPARHLRRSPTRLTRVPAAAARSPAQITCCFLGKSSSSPWRWSGGVADWRREGMRTTIIIQSMQSNKVLDRVCDPHNIR